MLVIYNLLIFFIILLSPLIILFRLSKGKEDLSRFKEKFCFFSINNNTKKKLIWFHGASVGELLSIIPLIEKLEKNNSIGKILITSTTLSSSRVLNKYKFKKTIHQFFPIDSIYFTNKFLNYWKPSMAVFVESEIWPNMIVNIKKKDIPLILLNARISSKTFKRWKIFSNFSNFIFKKFDLCLAQSLETKKYLKFLGAKKIRFCGNLKFSESKQDNKLFSKEKFSFNFNSRKIWCASSTHPNEEIDCAKIHQNLRKKYNNILTIIIPRHINRTNEIKTKIQELGLVVSLRSSNKQIKKNTDIYLVDTYGEVSKFFSLSNIAFLGGSIVKHGGQNPLEPARLGNHILSGPNFYNFKEIYAFLGKNNISITTSNFEKMKKTILKKLNNGISFKNRKKIFRIGDRILNKNISYLTKYIA